MCVVRFTAIVVVVLAINLAIRNGDIRSVKLNRIRNGGIMNREIKFRGKSLENGEWLYGDLVRYFDMKRSVILVNDTITYNECEVDTETIGQFTGVLDKNGKEIYEGDIIGCPNPEIKHLIFYNENEGRFMAALNGDTENNFVGVCGLDNMLWNASKEVIGNIHDNPELLKETRNGKDVQTPSNI